MPAWKLARRRFIVKLSSSPGCLLKQGQKMLKDRTGGESKIVFMKNFFIKVKYASVVIVGMIVIGLILSY